MAYLQINHAAVDAQKAAELTKLCPFEAFRFVDDRLCVTAACKMCGLCVKKGPTGAVEMIEEKRRTDLDKSLWSGIAVYVEQDGEMIHPVTFELIGKACSLALQTGQPVYALFVGHEIKDSAAELLHYGVDEVFVYDHEHLSEFNLLSFANIFSHFIEHKKPSAVLVGATNVGRSLAPRVAARFKTGLTADCTVLDIKQNTDLIQIRPAFGGNIMAQIITPDHRPQFCTVRYKVFSAPMRSDTQSGCVKNIEVTDNMIDLRIKVQETHPKSKDIDISDAEIIVAVGRGVKSKSDLATIEQLADSIGAVMACTRPLIENGWFDAKRQIGLSGRTVKPKLLIAIGISGAVQFTAGMKESECIIAINTDKLAPIFDVASFGYVGNWYEILPRVTTEIKTIQSERNHS